MKARISLLSIIVVIAINGCKSSTSTPDPVNTSGNLVRPGVGSSYIFHLTSRDTNGNLILSRERYDTLTVIASGIPYQGKSNVVQFRTGSASAPKEFTYYNYESNGDMSLFNDGKGSPGKRSGWEIIPLAGKGSQSFISWDTVINGGHVLVTDSWMYSGEETITLAGHTWGGLNVRYAKTSENGHKDYDKTYWFVPSIGFEAKIQTTWIEIFSQGEKTDLYELINYDLK